MTRTRFSVLLTLAFAISSSAALDAGDKKKDAKKGDKPAAGKKDAAKPKWTSLFDGKTLKGWEITKFGGEGDVKVKDGAIILGVGSDMTGIHTKRKLPRINYDVELDAQRVDGSDFFCGFTFMVDKKPCSLILGGWGGGVVGLSSLDGFDASENNTSSFVEFKNKKWYHIKLRVTPTHIQAWIDKEQIVDARIEKRQLSVRIEVEPSLPFGFSTWQTTGALKNIRIRELTAEEVKQTAKTGAQF